jgi:signal transduction histidine kinase
MFQVFHRASNVDTVPGTGLGLAIARRAVDLHQGAISFESQVGVGTTFTVRMPLRPSGPALPDAGLAETTAIV